MAMKFYLLAFFAILAFFYLSQCNTSDKTLPMHYTAPMWPFHRKRGKKRGRMDKLIAGIIIGGAIGSIIGKKLLEKKEGEDDPEEEQRE